MKPTTKATTTKKAKTAEAAPAKAEENPKPNETAQGKDAVATPPEPEVVKQDEAKPDPVEGQDKAPAKAEENPASARQLDKVVLGGVECAAENAPIDTVTDLLSPEGLARVEALRGLPSTGVLSARVRETDGRCAPVAISLDAEGVPSLFDGYDVIAAAKDAGMERVFVIAVPAGGEAAVASQLAAMRHKLTEKPNSLEEDDLIFRVLADD